MVRGGGISPILLAVEQQISFIRVGGEADLGKMSAASIQHHSSIEITKSGGAVTITEGPGSGRSGAMVRAAVLVLVIAVSARATPRIQSGNPLSLEGRSGEVLNGAVVVEKAEGVEVRSAASDLRDETQKLVISRASITITVQPAFAGDTRQTFTIAVAAGAQPGTYSGEINFYDGASAPATINVTAKIRPTPSLKTATISTPELVRCSGPLDCKLAWFLLPRAMADSPSSVALAVLSNEKSAPIVLDPIFITATAATHNDVLGSDVLRVSRIETSLPRVVIEAPIDPTKLQADQYSGVIYGKVNDVADLIVMPFSFSIRSGPLSALWWLLGGLALGFFVHWMDAKGHPQSAILIRADRVRHGLDRVDAALLEPALDEVRDLAYRFRLDAAQTKMLAVEDRADKLRQLRQIELDLRNRPDPVVVEPILTRIEKVRQFLRYQDDDSARAEIRTILTEIGNLPPVPAAGPELERSLDGLRRSVTTSPKRPWNAVRWSAARQRLAQWIAIVRADFLRYIARPVLWLGLVLLLLYIGIYLFWVKNASFGAQLADHVSLILWGLSSNVAGAKLTSLPALVR